MLQALIMQTRNKKLTFKNNTPFSWCISKINNLCINNAEVLDLVMPMYNVVEYIVKYSMTGCLWNYWRDELNDDANENNDSSNYKINNNKTTTSKSFEYMTKIIGSAPADNSRLDSEVVVPLKYLSNFWKSHDLPFIDHEIELDQGQEIVQYLKYQEQLKWQAVQILIHLFQLGKQC